MAAIVAAPASAPNVVEAPVVDLPWEAASQPALAVAEPVVAPVVSEPAVSEAVAALQPVVTEAEPSVVAAVPAPAAVVPAVAQAEEGDDDEPPPGDYDYAEVDGDSLDYDFDVSAADVQAEPEPLPAAKPATGLAAEWLDLFPRLGLSGMTGSIGANCTLIEADGDAWLLHLDPGHSALFNATQQRRLNDALNQHLGRNIELRIELILPEQETPAQAAARKRAERQRLAEQSIQDDPLVLQMIQQFGAVIRADSIEPLNT